mmetsp:Transcript_41498/g.58390  ORF Transcript_41498/g.58390 Transcript_41498/m.58390 type:complete len:687 (+) Transcript_41498:662-2722(+)
MKFECGCVPGYVCRDTDCTVCVTDTTHPCNINNAGCSDFATCNALSNNRFQCKCNTGYEGDGQTCTSTSSNTETTETETNGVCDPNPCNNETSTCSNVDGVATCSCLKGFQQISAGGTCFDIDECSTIGLNECSQNRSICTNTPGDYLCQCITGFNDFPETLRGTDCRSLEEINAAISAGTTVAYSTGFDGLRSTDFAEGSAGRAAYVREIASEFELEEDDVRISNVTEILVSERRLADGSRSLQRGFYRVLFQTSCFVRAVSTQTTDNTQTTETSISYQSQTVAVQNIRARARRLSLYAESLTVSAETSETGATTITQTLTQIRVQVTTRIVQAFVQDSVIDTSQVQTVIASPFSTISVVETIVDVSIKTTETIIQEAAPSPFIQEQINSGISATPTGAPSIINERLLAMEDEEDFFGDFAMPACKCIDCDPLTGCESLWAGRMVDPIDHTTQRAAHVVISTCDGSVGDVAAYLGDVRAITTTIISRCGKHVHGAPEEAVIVHADKVDSDDEAFLEWIVHNYHEQESKGNVIFIGENPDNIDMTKASKMVRAAEMSTFRCGSKHVVTMSDDISKSAFCKKEGTSQYIQTCKSSAFATTMEAIRKQELSLWNGVERDFSSRMNWASLLSPPLTSEEIEALESHSTGVDEEDGCLIREPTSPTEVKEVTGGSSFSRFLKVATGVFHH